MLRRVLLLLDATAQHYLLKDVQSLQDIECGNDEEDEQVGEESFESLGQQRQRIPEASGAARKPGDTLRLTRRLESLELQGGKGE